MTGMSETSLDPTSFSSGPHLYSQVNSCPESLSSTSEIALVGLASMGFTGTPGVSLHICWILCGAARRAWWLWCDVMRYGCSIEENRNEKSAMHGLSAVLCCVV